MVIQGSFSVQLVEAATKETFKEHTYPGGKTFAEVEPEIDYFIAIDAVRGSKKKVFV